MSSKQHTSGFTIIELSVVIIVIGILAAISLVAYNGSQQRAAAAQSQSDLHTSASQLESYRNFNTGYPIDEASARAAQALSSSSGVTLSYTYIPATKDYCLSATSSRSGVSVYNISSLTEVITTGVC